MQYDADNTGLYLFAIMTVKKGGIAKKWMSGWLLRDLRAAVVVPDTVDVSVCGFYGFFHGVFVALENEVFHVVAGGAGDVRLGEAIVLHGDGIVVVEAVHGFLRLLISMTARLHFP